MSSDQNPAPVHTNSTKSTQQPASNVSAIASPPGPAATEHSTPQATASNSTGEGTGAPFTTGPPLPSEDLSGGVAVGGARKKVPRRVIHCSDGIIEEYSTDEEQEVQPAKPEVDPHTLQWFPWMWYYIVVVFFALLSVADGCGEKLAWFFGITSPKYQYAIDEFHRLQEEDKEEEAREQREKDAELKRKLKDFSDLESGSDKTTDGKRDQY